ncbi:MAG: septum formation initiator family protein [Elusimicrobia bacterium]|nr:septum formation initiator family protein [Elusimicrobiota bacterium]
MTRRNLRRRAFWVLGGVLVLSVLVCGGAVRHYWLRREDLQRLEDRLAESRRRMRSLEARLARAENDEEFIELAARRELGLLRPGEIEFRFVDDASGAPPSKKL